MRCITMTSRRERTLAVIAMAFTVTMLTSGCTSESLTVEDPRAQTPVPTRIVETLDGPGGITTPGPETPEPTESTPPTDGQRDKRPPRVDALRVGDDDFSALEWDITCGELDSAPSVLGTAEKDGNQYVFMLLASGTDQLLSFTFSYGPDGGGHASKTGLTVTPGGGQGNGTFTIDGTRIISDGRGISYSPEGTDRAANTLYTAEFTCAAEK